MLILTARWVVPLSAPPIESGALLLEGGKIGAVGTLGELKALAPGARVQDEGEVILMPALVNAHTHLELTDLRHGLEGRFPPASSMAASFTDWIKDVIGLKRGSEREDFCRSIELGLKQCARYGQGVVADVLSVPADPADEFVCVSGSGPRVMRQAELICGASASASELVRAALERQGGWEGDGSARAGLFLHAPYTVCEEAFIKGAEQSLARWGRYFSHIAESPDEIDYCMDGAGPVVDELYASLPVQAPPHPGMHPVDWLHDMGLLLPGAVLVHAVNVTVRHIGMISDAGAAVVLCPRSNMNLGVGAAPGRKFLDAGVTVALGTDSVLSAGDLNLFNDMVAAVDLYGFSPLEALSAATAGGASVLGLAGETGAFSRGASADILAVDHSGGGDPLEALISSNEAHALWRGGVKIV